MSGLAIALLIFFSLLTVFVGGTLWLMLRAWKPRPVSALPPPTQPDPEPICGCGHHYALHTEEGACGSQASERLLVERSNPVVKETGMYGDNHKVFYENERWEVVTRDCPCRRYTGPEPMPRYLP